MVSEHRREFDLFGSRVVLLVGAPTVPDAPPAELAALACEAQMRQFNRTLSRFDPSSELSRLNADPRETVPVSPLLALFVEVALAAADRTGGLVDPALLDAVRCAGYRHSRVGEAPAGLCDALEAAPPRAPAAPSEVSAWRLIKVETIAGTVTRPPGVEIDSGGIGKGLAADLCATRLGRYSSYAVDCGGDLRIGGAGAEPRRVTVADPFGGARQIDFELERGAVATSGISNRVWKHDAGFAHHLIDPGRGTSAWTGVVQATAVAPTAVEAEALAKAALLAGPEEGPSWLREWGGVTVGEDGISETVGGLVMAAAR